jgi:hypothetical protein
VNSIRLGLVFAVLAASGCSAPDPVLAGSGGAGGTGGSAGLSGGAGKAAAGFGGAAAGAAGAAGTPMPGTFGAVAEIMRQNCGLPACHGGGPDGQDLVYTNIATLHNVLMTTLVSECNNNPLVTPSDPANSALLKLPNWDCTDPMGAPFVMPQGCIDDPCLQPAELASITAWIMAGAKP